MACPGLEQETAYLAAMATVSAYRVEGDQLVLLNADGDTVLVFRPRQHASLEGTNWQLTGYNTGNAIVSLIRDTKVTAAWADGQVSGSAGCNSYFASYAIDGEQLTHGVIGATEMFCGAPEGLMEQETGYLKALGASASYRIDSDRLTVLGSNGERLLEFVAAQE
jgi:heat shock protein HslJ